MFNSRRVALFLLGAALVALAACSVRQPDSFPKRPAWLASRASLEAAGSTTLRASGGGEPGLLLLGWRAELASELAAVVRAVPASVDVAVVAPPCELSTVLATVVRTGGKVGFVAARVEAPWVRDYGPLLASTAAGGVLVDASYGGRRRGEDALPGTLGRAWDVPVRQLDLDVEGGNLVVSPEGACYATRRLLERNEGLSETDVVGRLRAGLGCAEVRWLDRLRKEPTEHADVMVAFVGGRPVVAEAVSDEKDAVVLSAAAEVVGAEAVRVPLVRDAQERVLSYAQVIDLGAVLLAPSYALAGDPPRVAAADSAALEKLRAAFPDKEVTAVQLGAHMRELGGGLHCLGLTVPTPRR